ncbi:hypothetical protein TBLA_0G02420 [Henningerozyma blattae CBS 6284]|uniref:Uncharacterized protein n=1 Tax=Henningerozyma blattae (strain ATCC 34711 / CBS 6284 / DSM 70876 / NBRC 10599 / NRRL Y-10934 / UCD 77-7) TaxID=1071380 RepID=I2H730_HENB6|nr:hypothetical protein TBLA_0G02420 [Tetrapisispora blattae CBS 6284]CCH62182.1 hypothetical protein TBLA_0G02420 [Tetrapisispora blattae CBS 6284]
MSSPRKLQASYQANNPEKNSKSLLEVIFGPDITDWSFSEEALIRALDYKVESEKTKQQYYKFEVINRSIELLKIAKTMGLSNSEIISLFKNEILPLTGNVGALNTKNLGPILENITTTPTSSSDSTSFQNSKLHISNFSTNGGTLNGYQHRDLLQPLSSNKPMDSAKLISKPHIIPSHDISPHGKLGPSFIPSPSGLNSISLPINQHQRGTSLSGDASNNNFFQYKFPSSAETIPNLKTLNGNSTHTKSNSTNSVDSHKFDSLNKLSETAAHVREYRRNLEQLREGPNPDNDDSTLKYNPKGLEIKIPTKVGQTPGRDGSISSNLRSPRIIQQSDKTNTIASICNSNTNSPSTTIESKHLSYEPSLHDGASNNTQLLPINRYPASSSIPSAMTSILAFTKESEPSKTNTTNSTTSGGNSNNNRTVTATPASTASSTTPSSNGIPQAPKENKEDVNIKVTSSNTNSSVNNNSKIHNPLTATIRKPGSVQKQKHKRNKSSSSFGVIDLKVIEEIKQKPAEGQNTTVDRNAPSESHQTLHEVTTKDEAEKQKI